MQLNKNMNPIFIARMSTACALSILKMVTRDIRYGSDLAHAPKIASLYNYQNSKHFTIYFSLECCFSRVINPLEYLRLAK